MIRQALPTLFLKYLEILCTQKNLQRQVEKESANCWISERPQEKLREYMIQFCRKGIGKNWHPRSRFAKRLMDIALSLPLLFLFSPLLVAILLFVRMRHGSPVLFRQ